MKKLIISSNQLDISDSVQTIRVTMYIRPEIYSDFEEIVGSTSYDSKKRQYHTDINPNRIINGPLSEYGQQLESPIKEEYESFVKDCKWLINEGGFTIIDSHQSTDSKKSEYVLMFGLNDVPCGTLIYDLRISDHPFDATFPEEWKQTALEYLKLNNILDGTATEAGVDFEVEKITVGSIKSDTWDKAFNRLYLLLKKLKRAVRIRLNR